VVNFGEAEPQYPGFLTAADLIRFYAEAKKAADSQVSDLKEAFGIDPDLLDFHSLHLPVALWHRGMVDDWVQCGDIRVPFANMLL
jgi:ABC-2 type transport system ATP-binding protein